MDLGLRGSSNGQGLDINGYHKGLDEDLGLYLIFSVYTCILISTVYFFFV